MGGNANDVVDRVAARQEKRREIQNARNSHIRSESGELDDNHRLTAFLYILVRDHIPPGILEEILINHVLVHEEGVDVEYTNGWLLEYVKDVANVFTRSTPLIPPTVDRPNPTRKVKEDGS